jgi:RNA polymerase sigma factor (sigma-70 family)
MMTINIIFTIFLLFIFVTVNTLYLNKTQQTAIKNLIKNNQLSFSEREKINNVLFVYYKDSAHNRARFFKYTHRYKCRNIEINDLKSAAEFGLMKAALNYNGNSSFYYYSSLHIKNELLHALTNHNTIAPISKTTLRNGFSSTNKKFTLSKYYDLQNKLNVIYESITTPQFLNVISEKNNHNHKYLENIIQAEENERMWDEVISLLSVNPLMKKLFLLKYNKEFQKIRTDKEISKIVGYSPVHVARNIKKIKNILCSNYNNTMVIMK